MKKGIFITFEGAEGGGKSTQIKKAATFLKNKGCSVLLLREPGGTRVSEAIRKILLDKKLTEMQDVTELFLYLAARAQIVREKILPALKKGKIVICDRYEDSTIAYQGYGRKLSFADIKKCGRVARGNLKPQLTFLLDIDTKEGLKRGGRHDRIEKEKISFHKRVRLGYLALAKKEPKRVIVLNGKMSREVIASKIQEKLKNVLKN